jgi:outer membrane protein OmpA-like peptidoglycan-associated protein
VLLTMIGPRGCTAVFERDPAQTVISDAPNSPMQIAPSTTTATSHESAPLPTLETGASLIVHPTLLPQSKGIASATVSNGVLRYVAQSGFSGKTNVPLLYTAANGVQTIILVPVTVLPAAPKVGSFTPKDPKHTTLVWESSPNAIGYQVHINGVLACVVESVSLCTVNRILGPANRIEVTALGNDGTLSTKTINAYAPDRFISLVTVRFAPNKAGLSNTATKSLTLFVKLMLREGFTSVKVRAYTDSQGGARNAASLSSRRAQAVAKFLSKYLRVTIVSVPRGLKDPVASNLTTIGQALNRRATAAVR